MLSAAKVFGEAPLADFKNRKELEAWLRTQPRGVSVSLASRAALRALPVVQTALLRGGYMSGLVLPVFRATAVSWAAAKYPANEMELTAAAQPAHVAAGDASHADVHAAATAADAAAYAAHTANAPASAFAIAPRAANAAANAYAIVANAAEAAYDALWSTVSTDATLMEQGRAASEIAGLPLWPNDQPDELRSLWQKMKETLLAAKQDWDVWTDWYDDRLAGRVREEERELAYVRIADDPLNQGDPWNQGPAIVNAEIRRRIKKFKPPGRKKKESKPSSTPKIPPQRPAALEPVWSNGILVLPSNSAETDGDPEALASALKVLREEIAELADDADGEANIDKRPIAYLRRNAERIPDHAPTQDELFHLAHVKEFLDGYSKTVNDEWPDFLARRFHTLTLHFDRTVRQFPKWRDFVRNAERDRLTPGQVAEVPELAQAMVDALRDEDAREFIDPPIPAALEKLQAPLKADSENAAQAQLPAIRSEGLLLAEDTVESINNIVKEAVAAALAEAQIPKAPSRTKAVGPKTTMGIRETAKEALSGFDAEVKKSVIKESKRLGKETGPALTKWAKRLFYGSAIAGTATAATPALAERLIDAFPDKFHWLQAIIAFFS
jgi:hypothetical protein